MEVKGEDGEPAVAVAVEQEEEKLVSLKTEPDTGTVRAAEEISIKHEAVETTIR